jgi:hypothetical protein
LAYIVPIADVTTTTRLATNDAMYLGGGLRITQASFGIANRAATSNNISVGIDGMVSAATANLGAINLTGTSTRTAEGVSNSQVFVGLTGSVVNLGGHGIAMAGMFAKVDNAGNIQARQVGVDIIGDRTDITNSGVIYGAERAIAVVGDGAEISNAGGLQSWLSMFWGIIRRS